MPKISILSDNLINKIAAGEIIERPAAVVRELIDNSIDAGAKNISVEILHGGKKLIKVSDDGIGMDREDAVLCLERHATSKITSEDDLFNISTLGFRGEALPSIASVSKVTLVTSGEGSDAGTRIEISSGHKKTVADAPASRGTIMEVRDLFYNVPARRKFLKTTSTELSHIIDVVMQKSLPYFETAFSLNHNGSDVINVHSVKNLRERFIQLYSEELVREFIEARKEGRGIKLYGFLSTPDFTRAGRGYQYIFINRRAVKNPTASHAVYAAYSGLIPKDRHPAFFLFLDIDPRKIDVNVHPAKREVRFESPDEIHKLIESAVNEAVSPKRTIGADYTHITESPGSIAAALKDRLYSSPVIRESLPESALGGGKEFQTDFFAGEIIPSGRRYFYIGESFVAAVTDKGLIIIDQHAAHERILYEKFLKRTKIEIESLFLPVRVELPPKEFNVIMSCKNFLHDFGFDIDEFGANNVIVRALPRELNKADIKGLLLDIASGILEEEESGAKDTSGKEALVHNISARLACHKSVRGSEPLNDHELSRLLSDLEKTEMPDKCPHGRPTKIFFSLDDLRKMFKRK